MPWSRASNKIAAQNMPVGSVIQAVTFSMSSNEQYTSPLNSPTIGITGCRCSISPLFSNSKLLVIFNPALACEWIDANSDTGFGAGIYSSLTGTTLEASAHSTTYWSNVGFSQPSFHHWVTPNSTANHYYAFVVVPYANNGRTRVHLNRNYQGTNYSKTTILEFRQ